MTVNRNGREEAVARERHTANRAAFAERYGHAVETVNSLYSPLGPNVRGHIDLVQPTGMSFDIWLLEASSPEIPYIEVSSNAAWWAMVAVKIGRGVHHDLDADTLDMIVREAILDKIPKMAAAAFMYQAIVGPPQAVEYRITVTIAGEPAVSTFLAWMVADAATRGWWTA